MPSSHPLASQHPLFGSIQSAAATQTGIADQIKAAFNAIESYVLLKGRESIDTPGERQQIEAVAIQAFNGLFASALGPTTTAIIDGFVVSMIDRLLVYLAATPVIPAPTPDPVPQGSAA